MTLNVDNIDNWVFVTGLIRSGTTFTGTVLSLPLSVDYIHEPFGRGCGMPAFQHLPPRYLRPGAQDGQTKRYHELISRIFRYDFTLRTSRYEGDPWWRKGIKQLVGSRGPFYLRLAKINPFHRAAVIKDPRGLLMTEYLYCTFGVRPVIVVRHPVSLAASLRRMGWWPGLDKFERSPALVEDYLMGEEAFLERDWPDPLSEAMACWRLSHQVVLAQLEKYPDWQLITHEALSQRPLETFRQLYDALGLLWSQRIARRLQRMTQGRSAGASGGRAVDMNRDSAGIFEKRRNAIPKEERQAIFDLTGDVALRLYDRQSFAID